MNRPVLVAAAQLLSLPLYAADLWLHVRSEEHDGRRGRVVINLPLRAIQKALPLIPADISRSCELRLNGSRIRPADLRLIVQQLRSAPSGAEIRVSDERDSLRFRRDGETLIVTADRDWHSDGGSLSVPLELAEALLGRKDHLDLRSAVALLVRRGEGEIMMVDKDDQTIRVWVDRSAAAPLRQSVAIASPSVRRTP